VCPGALVVGFEACDLTGQARNESDQRIHVTNSFSRRYYKAS